MNTGKPGATERNAPEKDSAEKSPAEDSSAEKRAAAQTQAAPAPAQAAAALVPALEQIREILFGAIYREIEQSLGRVEAHATSRAREIEHETRARSEAVEQHLKKEVEILAGRVEMQLEEINENVRALGREHREAMAQVERKLLKSDDVNANGLRDMRQQLLEQAKAFLDQIQEVRREVLATLQRELALAEGDLTEERVEAHTGSPH